MAVDAHVVAQITAASVPSGDGGSGAYESILYAQEAVWAAGYNPSLIVCSPADALTVQLLQMGSGVTYLFEQTKPDMVLSPAIADGGGFVCDPTALGVLYLKPFQLAAYQESDGGTNSALVRGESDGVFVVQREDAAAYWMPSS